MARRTSPPKYARHSSGQARVRIDGRVHYLGEYGTPESRQKYNALVAKWLADGQVTHRDCPFCPTRQVHAAYLDHCRAHYRKGGKVTTEVACIELATRHLVELYGDRPASELDALKLERVRDAMIADGWVRTSINRHMGRVRRLVKWAVKHKLIPRGVYIDVCTLEPLQAERSAAAESEPVEAVADAVVDACLPFMSRPVQGLVEFMRLTGARPGEALIVRGCDLNMAGKVWEYRPQRHKLQHHKKQRVIMIGRLGQRLLRDYLKTDLNAFLFDPRDAIEAAASRYRVGAKRRQDIGQHYTLHSLAAAIRRACIKADVSIWSANQLRHSFGTKARRSAGIEGSRVVLGHSSAVTSEIYAERDFEAARAVVGAIG